MADIHLDRGDVDAATTVVGQALAIHRETGHRPGEARALVVLGKALAASGRDPDARAEWQRALVMFTEMGMPEVAEAGELIRAGWRLSGASPVN